MPASVPCCSSLPSLCPSVIRTDTFRPTNAPMLSMLSEWRVAIDAISLTWRTFTSGAAIDYTSLLLGKEQVQGSCEEWAQLTSETLSTQRITSTPHRLIVVSVQSPDPTNIPWVFVECTDQRAVREVVDKLQYWAAHDIISVSNVSSVQCQNNTFVVGWCAGSTTGFLCADCAPAELLCVGSTVPQSHMAYFGNCGTDTNVVGHPSTALHMLHVEFTASFPLPQISSVQITSLAESLQVEVLVPQTGGFVTCQAFASAAFYVPTDWDISLWREGSSTLRAPSTIIHVTNLQPVTSYDVYCATYSDIVGMQSLWDVLSSKQVGVTTCCRIVEAFLRVTSFVASNDISSALTVRLSSDDTLTSH